MSYFIVVIIARIQKIEEGTPGIEPEGFGHHFKLIMTVRKQCRFVDDDEVIIMTKDNFI